MLAVLMGAEEPIGTLLTVDAFFTLAIVSFFIPSAVGLITKVSAPPIIKQAFAIVFSALASFIALSTQQDGTSVFSKEGVLAFLLALGIQLMTHFGVYKPLGIPQKLAPNSGVG
jgi:hypothetical protein